MDIQAGHGPVPRPVLGWVPQAWMPRGTFGFIVRHRSQKSCFSWAKVTLLDLYDSPSEATGTALYNRNPMTSHRRRTRLEHTEQFASVGPFLRPASCTLSQALRCTRRRSSTHNYSFGDASGLCSHQASSIVSLFPESRGHVPKTGAMGLLNAPSVTSCSGDRTLGRRLAVQDTR